MLAGISWATYTSGMNADEWAGTTGRSWAEEWKHTDRSFSMLTEHLLDRRRSLNFSRVLDVGCGVGALADDWRPVLAAIAVASETRQIRRSPAGVRQPGPDARAASGG